MSPIRGAIQNVIILCGLAVLITQLATGSLNPLDAFGSQNLVVKIVVGVLLLWATGFLLMFAVLRFIPEDARCADDNCGKSVRQYVLVYRGAMMCPQCGRWYHGSCWRSNRGCLYHRTGFFPGHEEWER